MSPHMVFALLVIAAVSGVIGFSVGRDSVEVEETAETETKVFQYNVDDTHAILWFEKPLPAQTLVNLQQTFAEQGVIVRILHGIEQPSGIHVLSGARRNFEGNVELDTKANESVQQQVFKGSKDSKGETK